MDIENPYIRMARPDHWIKQLFVVPGFALALLLADGGASIADMAVRAVLALVATSAIASSNYVLNEWLDRDFDKFHPVKRNRAAVRSKLSPAIVYAEWAILAIVGLAVGSFVNLPCLAMLASLWVMGIMYNARPLRTKDVPYLDVLSESANNALRLMIGWFAIAPGLLPPCSAVLGYWMGGAYLMAVKRFSEYRSIADPVTASAYRKSFDGYTERSLLASAVFYAMLSTLLIGVFLVKYHVEYILGMPVLCLLYIVYLNMAFEEDSATQAPEKLIGEKKLMACVLAVMAVFVALTFLEVPQLSFMMETTLVRL